MFLGEYNPNITKGSRISLPKKLRENISGDTAILSRGFEECIFVYDKEDWLEESKKQIENPISDKKMRDLKRYMYASASEVSIDSQGRIVVPPNLTDYANLDKSTAVIGAGDHIEIWDAEVWENRLEEISKQVAE